MNINDKLYTKEPDGTVARWYVFGWYGPRFAVSPVKNAKLKDYKRYYGMEDIGKAIFMSRKEASHAEGTYYGRTGYVEKNSISGND